MKLNWDGISAIGQLVGALGVIVSVLYLAFQVRGERDATLANTRQLRQNGVRETALAVATSEAFSEVLAKASKPTPVISALMEVHGLSQEEAWRLNWFNIGLMRQLETNLRMDMEREERDETIETIRTSINGQIGIWWPYVKPVFSRSFVEEVEKIIAADI